MLNSKSLLLIVAAVLIFVGLTKPDLSSIVKPKPDVIDNIVVITPPENFDLRKNCKLLTDILDASSSKDKREDFRRLSDLYMDLATLVELDGDDEVIKTTEEIKQANSLSGAMLRMNIKGKYQGLSDAAEVIIIGHIGNDIVPLDSELRKKSAEAFRALAWAYNEGAK